MYYELNNLKNFILPWHLFSLKLLLKISLSRFKTTNILFSFSPHFFIRSFSSTREVKLMSYPWLIKFWHSSIRDMNSLFHYVGSILKFRYSTSSTAPHAFKDSDVDDLHLFVSQSSRGWGSGFSSMIDLRLKLKVQSNSFVVLSKQSRQTRKFQMIIWGNMLL